VRNHSNGKPISSSITFCIPAVTRKDIRVTCVDRPVLQRVLSPYIPVFTLAKNLSFAKYVLRRFPIVEHVTGICFSTPVKDRTSVICADKHLPRKGVLPGIESSISWIRVDVIESRMFVSSVERMSRVTVICFGII